MEKVKVLTRMSTLGVAGTVKYVIGHYQHINKDRFQCEFITRNQALRNVQQIKELNMPVNTFTATQQDNKELLVKEITDILDKGYNVLHMNTSIWAGFLIEELAMERNISVIVHSHNSDVDAATPAKRKEWLERHEYYKKRFGKEYANYFCACSRQAADWLFGPQIPRDEIRILKNAIEVERYSYDSYKRKRVRQELGLDNNFVIGCVGRFAYQKNHGFLIDVFQKIYTYNNKARLILIGKGELETEVRKQVNEYGLEQAVLFLGWRDDVNELMQAMDVFALPSRFEGLPIVAVEAQTAGLPCLLSDAISEEVRITENVTMLPFDIELWEKEIISLMNGFDRKNTDEKITKAGYNISFAVKELEKLYEECVKG